MYYTDEKINAYFNSLQSNTKMTHEEIIVLQLDKMRSLAEELKLEPSNLPGEVYQFKKSQKSKAYLFIVAKEFNSLVDELNNLVKNQHQNQLAICKKHRQTIELSSKIFKLAKEAIPATHRPGTKLENIRCNLNMFTLATLESVKEKSKNVDKPVSCKPLINTNINKKEKKLIKSGIDTEAKLNELPTLNSNLQTSDKKIMSSPSRYSLEKLFPVWKPTLSLVKKPERTPLVLLDDKKPCKGRGTNNSNSTVLDREKDELIKPCNYTFSKHGSFFSKKNHRKRKFNEINNNNEQSGSAKKTQFSTYFNKDTSFFKGDYDSSNDDDYSDEKDTHAGGYSS